MSLMDEIYDRIGDKYEPICYNKSDSEIAKFFADQTLFITGVTGYLGTSILEKLLRSCPGIKRIYILARGNKKYSLDDRMKKLFQHVVFSRLREENPSFQDKVTVIKGDLMSEGLGISSEDRNTIIENVSVIYHNAANVKFQVKASVSLRSNVLGTKKMLDLSRECKKLKLFVYVSTAYSHLYQKDIYEEFYPAPADLQAVYDAIEADEKTKDGLSQNELQSLIGKYPNIYPYTKAIAEDLVKEYAKDAKFALAVYRPSVVTPSYMEPLPGWCGNMNGPVLVYLGAFLGIMRAAPYNHRPVDLIPCDYTVNALFAISRDAYVQWKENGHRELVYNYGSSTVNPVTFTMFREFGSEIPPAERSVKTVALVSSIVITPHMWLFYILHFFLHFIPACLVDMVLVMSHKKPMALSIFWRFTRILDQFKYFSSGDWKIHASKTLHVIDKMNIADRQIFYCDIRDVMWEEITWLTCRAMKLYILKEEITSEAASRRYYLVYYAECALKALFILAFCYILFTLSSAALGFYINA